MSTLRENWRVIVLVILLGASSLALFVPTGSTADAGTNESGVTNLKYGIELSGGARIRAPIAGLTAENVSIGPNQTAAVETAVEKRLGVDPIDVVASAGQRTSDGGTSVEVFANPIKRNQFDSASAFQRAENATANVSIRELRRALSAANVDVSREKIRFGVTQATRSVMVRTIERKINAAGLSGGSARIAQTAGGQRFIVVEAPNRNVRELRELISQRGNVQVRAYFPRNGSYVNRTVLTQEMDFSVGAPSYNQRRDYHYVPITFEDTDDARQFANDMAEYGFGQGSRCPYDETNFQSASGTARCLLTVFDGKVIYAAGVAPQLGRSWGSGSFVDRPEFVMQTNTEEQARELQIALKAGRLPASLDFDRGSQFSVEPALAQKFKLNSLITGLIAVLAVAFVVYLRYGDPKVAIPMVVTALSEVVLLLGFAAAVGYPLDLSVIAGFIAVIGTGVDDLIIIADEVMAEGDVNSSRVFQSRFKKAFWVIGAAAATTILAMSPLAVLSLGDLQGFAIVTILGVLAGVLITRPAYGDILRQLTTGN